MKKIIYHSVIQRFTEFDEDGNIVKEDAFRVPSWTQDIIENDKATVVFLEDGSKGVAKVHPADMMIARTGFGRKLAFLRAKKDSIAKEIKAMLKLSHKL